MSLQNDVDTPTATTAAVPKHDTDLGGATSIAETEGLFIAYESSIRLGPEHPTALVETSTLSFSRPPCDPAHLHASLAASPALSAAQMEAVCLARMRNVDGNKALLIADGTGVGKGRELAACMLNHLRFHSAARKFVFVTASASLETDIRRDLGAVGWPFKTHPLRSMDVSADKPVPITKGILFITYSLLRTKGGGKRSRLDQVLAWLKTAGIEHPFLAFDEVHLAKGKTCTNAVVRELQTKLPNARVVYASATAGSTVQHLSCMPRLGLWGEGTPFPNHEAFAMRYKAACNSTMETVSTELAARGAFLSRRLSFADTTFDTQTAALTDEQTELHSRLCAWFAKLIALDVFDTKEGKAVLWGTHLRIFKALLIAFRVAAARDAAAAWIEAGGAVVVSLIGTGEAASARLADDADDDGCIEDSAFAGLRSTLSEIMDKASATDAAVSHGDALLALRTEVDEFDLPPSPLDALVDQLGSVGRVIELTGRSNAWTRGEDGKWAQQKRSSGDNTELCKEFQRGDAEIAIISAAASTGISLHDTVDFPSRRRLQIMLELPWAADTALQQMGRTHRSAQHTAPTYLLITSDLAAEGRFAATIAKRAADLGAVTSADRRGTQANSIGSDLLVGPHAPAGIRSLFGALESTDSWPRWYADSGKPVGETTAAIRGAFESVRFEQDDKVKSLSNRLLGRMLGVPKYASNAAIEVYSAACEEAHAHARRNHNLKDDPVEDMTIDGQCVVLEETSEHTGIIRVTRDIGMPYQAALAKKEVAEANDMGTGFAYRVETRRNGRPDRVFNVLAVQTGAGARVRAWRPNGRVSEYYPSDFVEIYKSYDDEDAARAAWDYEHELTLTQCNHGCLDGKTCGTGTRCVESCLMPFPGVTNRLGGLYHPRTSLVRVKKADGARAVVVKVESHVADGLEKAAAKARADAAKDQQLRAQEAAKLAATAANAQAAEKAEDEEIEKACQAAEVAEAAKNPSPPPASMASTASTASAEPVTDVPEAKSIGGKRKAPPPPPAATSKKKVVSMAPQAAAAASSSSSRISRPKPQKQLSMRAFLVAHSDDSDDE